MFTRWRRRLERGLGRVPALPGSGASRVAPHRVGEHSRYPPFAWGHRRAVRRGLTLALHGATRRGAAGPAQLLAWLMRILPARPARVSAASSRSAANHEASAPPASSLSVGR